MRRRDLLLLKTVDYFATRAFQTSSNYDTAIFKYFNKEVRYSGLQGKYKYFLSLRYGENPHQKGIFFGDPDHLFDKLHGKEISYNNLLDVDAAINLIDEFHDTTFVVIKHNNACGVAIKENPLNAWKDALACDPVSAYGGVIVTNATVDETTAQELIRSFLKL